MKLNQVIQGDCIELLRELPDSSVDLILTDPPYLNVKTSGEFEWWDRQWKSRDAFIDWLRQLAKEWKRVLKPNGSLYCFCSTALSAHTEVMLSEFFNVLSNIRWQKERGRHNLCSKEGLRTFFDASESIIFCEHYGSDRTAQGEAGYQDKCDEVARDVWGEYIKQARAKHGLTAKQLTEVVGAYGTVNHGGACSNWEKGKNCPTLEHYQKLQQAFPGYFTRPYEELRQQYEELRQQYEELRRPFNVTAEVPYTDVWTFPTVQAYKGKHPCEKPAAMLEHIITASSRPGALVLDCFGGSGSTGLAAQKHGRNYLLFEIDPHWVAVARQRLGESTEFVTEEARSRWLQGHVKTKSEIPDKLQLSLLELAS